MAKNFFRGFFKDMKVISDKNYSPLFCAKPVSKTSVLRKNILGKYTPSGVNVVRLDVYDKSDMLALERLDKKWFSENKKIKYSLHYYLDNIKNNAKQKLSGKSWSNREFYAMTRQRFFLNHLHPDAVIGVAQIHPDTGNLEYIQVRPKYQYRENAPRKIKHAGKRFLECLKNFTNGKSIRVYSDDNVKQFYRQQGGYPDENCRDIFYI